MLSSQPAPGWRGPWECSFVTLRMEVKALDTSFGPGRLLLPGSGDQEPFGLPGLWSRVARAASLHRRGCPTNRPQIPCHDRKEGLWWDAEKEKGKEQKFGNCWCFLSLSILPWSSPEFYLFSQYREQGSLRLYQSNIHHPASQSMLSRTPVPRGASSLCIMTFTGPVTSALFSPWHVRAQVTQGSVGMEGRTVSRGSR